MGHSIQSLQYLELNELSGTIRKSLPKISVICRIFNVTWLASTSFDLAALIRKRLIGLINLNEVHVVSQIHLLRYWFMMHF